MQMANVVVIGAGLGGLTTSMMLALDGHDVTVVERDPAAPTPPDQGWDRWERRGVNQFHLLHLMLPLWRQLMEAELPDAVARLDAAGALRWNYVRDLPAEVGGGLRDDDDRFEILTARRPFLEAVVAAAAADTYGVAIRRGAAVAGLLTGDPGPDGTPHVVGIRTSVGEDLRADLVVDASGRRSPLPGWLAAIGARPPLIECEDSGFVYYARHFHSADGSYPALEGSPLMGHDSLSILTLPAEAGTWGVGIITSSADPALRALRDVDVWQAVVEQFPLARTWVEAEPITGVQVMAKLEDRYRRLVVDGGPVATGIVALGDAWACTNPSLGRGASIALRHGCVLRDLLREVTADAAVLARRWDEETAAVVEPMYRATVSFDRHRLAEIDAQIAGRPYETDDVTWSLTKAFAVASRRDPDVLRAYTSVLALLATPEEALAEPDVFEAVMAAAPDADAPLFPGPDRAEVLALCQAVAA
jgi:2-polyprenyl-6-methoxyphenol hydroxylase-like FAD-dependent oxidoreductase